MYSKDNEQVCGNCVFSEPAKGVLTHCFCKKKNEYAAKSRNRCDEYKYDIFKRKVARKKNTVLGAFSPEDFKL